MEQFRRNSIACAIFAGNNNNNNNNNGLDVYTFSSRGPTGGAQDFIFLVLREL